MKRIEDSLRDIWDNIKHTNIGIIGVSEEEEKKKGSEKIFEEVIVENFPNMGKEISPIAWSAGLVDFCENQPACHIFTHLFIHSSLPADPYCP